LPSLFVYFLTIAKLRRFFHATRATVKQILTIIVQFPFYLLFLKIMERLVYNQLCLYLSDNKLLNRYQSGFWSFHSTATALLDATNQWYFNIDNGLVTSVVFLDLAKAFDTIDHDIRAWQRWRRRLLN